MAKDWKIKQTAMVKGQVETSSIVVKHAEAADVTAFCGLLEGGYEVTEINEAMSDMTKAETNAANTNPVSFISIYGPKNQNAHIKPYGGNIHFKNSVSGDDLRAVITSWKPFEMLPAEKPTYVGTKAGETTF